MRLFNFLWGKEISKNHTILFESNPINLCELAKRIMSKVYRAKYKILLHKSDRVCLHCKLCAMPEKIPAYCTP